MLNKNTRILIITGHGGKDNGATYGKLNEKNMNVTCGIAMFDLLRRSGINVTLEPNNGNVDYEMKISQGFDLVISIHFNAGGGDGFEAFCNPNNSTTVNICKAIEKRVQAFGQNSRGIKNGIGYKMVSGINPSAIILEGGFIDNPNDSKLFDEDHELINLGNAYGLGLLDYLGIKPTLPQSKEGFFRVVVGSYKDRQNAINTQNKLKEKGFDSFLVYEVI